MSRPRPRESAIPRPASRSRGGSTAASSSTSRATSRTGAPPPAAASNRSRPTSSTGMRTRPSASKQRGGYEAVYDDDREEELDDYPARTRRGATEEIEETGPPRTAEEAHAAHQADMRALAEALPPPMFRLWQKQQEYAALQALMEASAECVRHAERVGDMSCVMEDGGKAIGHVFENWKYISEIMSTVAHTLSNDKDSAPERLAQMVRMPYHGEQ